MNTILIFAACIFAYVNLGYILGHWSWVTFHTGCYKSWQFRLLFPISGSDGKPAFVKSDEGQFLLGGFKTAQGYRLCLAVVWPFKLLWISLIYTTSAIVWFSREVVGRVIAWLTTPIKLVAKINGA